MSYVKIGARREHPFTIIDTRILENENISWRAKGMLSYLISRPPNWKILIVDLVKRSTEGREACYSALAELGRNGYLSYDSVREKGKFVRADYTIFEEPDPKMAEKWHEAVAGRTAARDAAASQKAVSGQTESGYPDANKKDVSKKDINKKEEIKEKQGAAENAAPPPPASPSQESFRSETSTQGTATQERTRTATKSKDVPPAAALPEWLPLEDWHGYLAMRKAIKKPATEYAQKLVLKRLDELRQTGHDPALVLQTSIRSNWQDVYPLKNQPGTDITQAGKPAYRGKPRTSEEASQRDADEAAKSLAILQERIARRNGNDG